MWVVFGGGGEETGNESFFSEELETSKVRRPPEAIHLSLGDSLQWGSLGEKLYHGLEVGRMGDISRSHT